jgi:hypothetical protein
MLESISRGISPADEGFGVKDLFPVIGIPHRKNVAVPTSWRPYDNDHTAMEKSRRDHARLAVIFAIVDRIHRVAREDQSRVLEIETANF